jgi:Tfp pilus assembly protein PilO
MEYRELQMKKILSWQITEKQRTVILLLLLVFAIGFIYWTKTSYDSNFVDSF